MSIVANITFTIRDFTSNVVTDWTESYYYLNSNNVTDALAVWTQPGYFNVRRRIMSKDFAIVAVTAQQVGDRTQTADIVYPTSLGKGLFTSPDTDYSAGEQPWDGILCRITAQGEVGHATYRTRRNLTLRGIPQGALRDTTQFLPTPAFLENFQAWRTSLLGGGGFAVKHRTWTPTNQPIGVSVRTDGRSLVFTWAAGGMSPDIVPGVIVRTSGSLGAIGVNGVWRIKSTDLTTATTFPGRHAIAGTPSAPLTMDIQEAFYIPALDIQGRRGGERKTGRPSKTFRGRASARRA